MRKLFCLSAVCLLALCGCVRHYVITLNNGSQIDARSKPRLDGGAYWFKDALGRDARVPAGRVQEIAPASMVHKDQQPFNPKPVKP